MFDDTEWGLFLKGFVFIILILIYVVWPLLKWAFMDNTLKFRLAWTL